jgi:hypothetical protein
LERRSSFYRDDAVQQQVLDIGERGRLPVGRGVWSDVPLECDETCRDSTLR